MNGNMFRGFSYLMQGFGLIFQPGLRLFLIVPFIVNIGLFALLIVWAKSLISGWLSTLLGWMPEWLSFLEWLFWGIYLMAIVMTLFYGFVAAANLIGAPFYGFLAEKVEHRLTKRELDEELSWRTLVSIIPRTVKRELQKILYYLPRVLGLFVLGLIPGLNLLVAVAWIIFSSWMMALQYIDYPADNHNLSFSEMKQFLSEHRLSSFGFGLVAFGATLVPILNLITMPAAVCGGVAFWVNEREKAGEHNINLDFDTSLSSTKLEP